MPKIEPAVRQLIYLVPNGVSYIDIAKDLSKVNRRLYRQGMSYVIQDIQIGVGAAMRTTDVLAMSFSTIGNSWIAHNAWKKGYETWRRMQNEYMDGQGATLKGKWADFKVYLDDSMASGTTLEPYAGDAAVYAAGEWAYSNFVYDDAGTARSPAIHMIGTSTDDSAIGLIEAYGDARNYVQAEPANPTEISTGFYAQFHGVGDIDDELGIDIRDDNDLPPYDQDDYPGGATNADVAVIQRVTSCSGAQTTVTAQGFVAECGLIRVFSEELSLNNTTETLTDLSDAASAQDSPGPNSVYGSGTAPTAFVVLTVAPGPYRGVLAAPMGQ